MWPELPRPAERPAPKVIPHVVCADGYSLSVQASKFHYCTPREDWPVGGWTEVEVMAEDVPPHWSEWAADNDIYAYVPLFEVVAFIRSHGGLEGSAGALGMAMPEVEA